MNCHSPDETYNSIIISFSIRLLFWIAYQESVEKEAKEAAWLLKKLPFIFYITDIELSLSLLYLTLNFYFFIDYLVELFLLLVLQILNQNCQSKIHEKIVADLDCSDEDQSRSIYIVTIHKYCHDLIPSFKRC